MHGSGQHVYPMKYPWLWEVRVQELGWSWRFLITVFTLEFNLFYLQVNLSACSHEDCLPAQSVLQGPENTDPKGTVCIAKSTLPWCLLTAQTHLGGDMKNLATRVNV